MSGKLPVNNFEWIEDTSSFNEDFIKNYNGESDEGDSLEVDIQYPEKIRELRNDLPFLPEIIKFKKFGKFVANWYDKAEYIIHIWNLKQALNHRLILKKVHRLIKFNQKTWLKQSINSKIRQKAKNNFEKDFFKLMNSAVF